MGCVVEPTSNSEDTQDPALHAGATWTPYWWRSDTGSSFTGNDSNSNQVWSVTSGATKTVGAQYNENDAGNYSSGSSSPYYASSPTSGARSR